MKIVLWVLAGAVAVGALAVGGFFALLWLVNPVGDEWACSKGETPAGPGGQYSQCIKDGTKLPDGFTRDPLGNRPLAYNCHKHGWKLAEQVVVTDGVSEVQKQCVRKNTDLPLPPQIVTTTD